MTLTAFETWLMFGLISLLIAIIGYFLNKYGFSSRKLERSENAIDKLYSVPENLDSLLKDILEKLNFVIKDISEMRIDLAISNERHKGIQKQLSDHEERPRKREISHAQNHSRL